MKNKIIDVKEVKNYLCTVDKSSKIYLGSDSSKFKENGVWWAEYYIVLIVHLNGKNGCKVFGEITRERDFDQKKNRPRFRLMNEIYKVSELYIRLGEILEDFDVQIHIDINPNEKHGSSCVISEAIGYIKGMCGVTPLVKPHSWAASHCADRLKSLNVC